MNGTISIIAGNIFSALSVVKLFRFRKLISLPSLDCFLVILSFFFSSLQGNLGLVILLKYFTNGSCTSDLKALFASFCFSLIFLKGFSLQTHCPTLSQGPQAVLVVVTSQRVSVCYRGMRNQAHPQACPWGHLITANVCSVLTMCLTVFSVFYMPSSQMISLRSRYHYILKIRKLTPTGHKEFPTIMKPVGSRVRIWMQMIWLSCQNF